MIGLLVWLSRGQAVYWPKSEYSVTLGRGHYCYRISVLQKAQLRGSALRARGRIDVAVDADETVVALRANPLRFLAEVEVRRCRPPERPFLVTLGAGVFEFGSHTPCSASNVVQDTGFRGETGRYLNNKSYSTI